MASIVLQSEVKFLSQRWRMDTVDVRFHNMKHDDALEEDIRMRAEKLSTHFQEIGRAHV